VPDLPQRVPSRDAPSTLLVLLDDPQEREDSVAWLEEAGYSVLVAGDTQAACDIIARRLDLDVVISDVEDGEGDGVLRAAQGTPAGLEVILAGPPDVFVATQALARGAVAFLSRPFNQDDLLQQVLSARRAAAAARRAEDKRLTLTVAPEVRFEGLVGTSPRMAEVMEILRKASPTDAPVVILGESGTGKELVARAIHQSSGRRNSPFVAVHLHATPAGLLESDLFGHKKGAFTGAISDRIGKLEQADGGTLFLDELGDVPLETQVKLLRVLETHSFEPVGSNRSVSSDFRVIAATNQDIESMIAEKKFREELWFRVKVVRVDLPPLRERRADIPALVQKFVAELSARYQKEIEGIDPEALAALRKYHYKPPVGNNIRELRNVVSRMVILADGPMLTLRDVPSEIRGEESVELAVEEAQGLAGRPMSDLERDAIRETLKLTGGNRKAAADMLQIGERTLYRKIEKYGL
jgi:two-component system, NtrC family, response regulator HydG